MTDHDPCICPVCREAGMRNNPDKMIAELRKENARLRDALNTAAAAMDERRGYCDAWEWKYKETWDEEDRVIRVALEETK